MDENPLPPRRGTKALELWCRRITENYPNVKIDNMTTSWRDGLAFCALIHHFRPDLIDFDKLDKNDIYKNNELAFRVAEEYLGIPALLEANDMVKYEVPDRLSILTYLSQFCRAFGNQESTAIDRKISSFDNNTNNTNPSSVQQPSLNVSSIYTKRELCFKCGLPVFLAERISFNNNLYHNACFKCSRCDNQLISGTMAKFNTDSNEIICRTCSDKQMGMLLFNDDEQDDYYENDGGEGFINNIDTLKNEASACISDDLKKINLQDDENKLSQEKIIENNENRDLNMIHRNIIKDQDDDNEIRQAVDHNHGDDDEDDDNNLLNKSKFDDRKIQSNLSVSFASELLFLNVNNDNDNKVSLDDNNSVEENLTANTNLLNKITKIDNCISSDPDDNNLNNNSNNVLKNNIDNVNKEIVDQKIIDQNDNDDDDDDDDDVKETNLVDKINQNSEQGCDDKKMCFSNKNDINNDDNNDSAPVILEEELKHLTNLNDKTNDSLNTQYNKELFILKENVCDKEMDKLENLKQTHENENKKYPKDLNPFGDDDDDDDDDDDEKEIENDEKNQSSQHIPIPKISTNPFDDDEDDDEEDEDDVKYRNELPVPLPRRTPVPAPRRSLAVQSQSPFGSNQSINSIARHKKGKAPAPPVPFLSTPPHSITSPTSLSSENLSGSQRSTPKMKKRRPAPTPPNSTPIKRVESPDTPNESISMRRVIPLDISLLENENSLTVPDIDRSTNITPSNSFRKKIIPSPNTLDNLNLSERQLEKLKDNKEAKNRNRQSLEISDDAKMFHKKGPAPLVPIYKAPIKYELTNQEINHELEVIKVQQNGLEKQGVMLEKMIRNRSETVDELDEITKMNNESAVENLIMQLFEIVNEKNELFRRQAELLNLRRSYRLEQEQSELEYKIRVSMARPECNKTDSDKEREDALIAKLVLVVQQRNEVIECFEMDRLREIEEDLSIRQSIEMHSAQRESKLKNQTLTKLSKKEKKKLKENFKLKFHSKKGNLDVDKDEDESEVKPKEKSKKHKFKLSSIIK